MTNGFGAGFLTLGLLAAIWGLAALLGLLGIGVSLARRRHGRVPSLVGPIAAVLLAAVVAIAGFGVLALADEAAVGAAALVATVFVPLAAVGVRTRDAGDGRIDRLATAALAWSGPYLLAPVAFIGTNVVVTRAFDLAPAEARALGVGWLAVGVAGLTVTVGAWSLVGRASGLLGST
ncbi:MAG: hypothetical protein U5J98_09210 [Halobacteriales archaeon]|nr:hypothetical protein [Halobacteriales archaeon]